MNGEDGVNRIRVIKRIASERAKAARVKKVAPPVPPDVEERARRRAAAATIERWVGELRERKNAEMKQALGELLKKAA